MLRLVELADRHQVDVSLAYYPPYHSKYNPVERCFGVLENHWNGAILSTLDAVVGWASTMTWNGRPPTVRVVDTVLRVGEDGRRATDEILREFPPTSRRPPAKVLRRYPRLAHPLTLGRSGGRAHLT